MAESPCASQFQGESDDQIERQRQDDLADLATYIALGVTQHMLPHITVIFDCDGVLVDSERLSHMVLQQMLAEYGRELSLEETLDHFMGTSTEGGLSVLASLIGRPAPPDFLSVFQDRTLEVFKSSLGLIPGVMAVVEGLQSPYCVASNGPHEKMLFTLGHTGLLRHFKGRIFSAEDVALPKPAPDLFLHAATAMNVRPSSCVVVEDSPTGVKAAKAAGMVVLGYAVMGQGAKLLAAGADQVFQNMSDLPHLLRVMCGDAYGALQAQGLQATASQEPGHPS